MTWHEGKDEDGTVPVSDGEADRVDGFLVNLYLQTDGVIRTQTRIDLVKDEALRQISSLFWLGKEDKDNDSFVDEVAVRGHLVEYDSGTVKEQLLSLRYYGHHTGDKIWLVLAHMKPEGAAILAATCELTTGDDFNKACGNNDFDLYKIDADADGNGEPVESGAPVDGYKSTLDDFLKDTTANWTYGSYDKDKLDPRLPLFSGTGSLKEQRRAYFVADVPETPTPALSLSRREG